MSYVWTGGILGEDEGREWYCSRSTAKMTEMNQDRLHQCMVGINSNPERARTEDLQRSAVELLAECTCPMCVQWRKRTRPIWSPRCTGDGVERVTVRRALAPWI